jgi:hypothetical protein
MRGSVARWRWFWKFWVAVGIIAELWSLRVGTPLTSVARRYLLHYPVGAMLAGAFLAWLPYHWLLVREGLGVGDIVALFAGAIVGALGWFLRHPDEEEP